MKFRTLLPLTLAGILLLSCLLLVGAHFKYVSYETKMLVAVDYPPNQPVQDFQFNDKFWTTLSQQPEFQKLLVDEQVQDPAGWLESRFTVTPVKKNSQILELRMSREREDVSSLDDCPQLLASIAEKMREEVEADGATVEVLQRPSLPVRQGFLSRVFR